MAYVEPSTAANRSVDTLKDIRERNGPGSWRVPVAASARARVLLYQWLPGTASEGHIHPDADELFVVHEGRASFELDAGETVEASNGTVVYVAAGHWHAVRAIGEQPLVMMIVVSPNRPNDASTSATNASGA
jgi:oxalate decarboxylase/phosphoglucose isomerase-like protein (cupin superfamily)